MTSQLAALGRMATKGNDDTDAFLPKTGAFADAARAAMDEKKKADQEAASKAIQTMLETHEQVAESDVANLREFRRMERAKLAELKARDRARAYALEEGNVLPWAKLIGTYSHYDFGVTLEEWNNAEVPKDWAPTADE